MIRLGQGVDNGIRAVIYLARQEVDRRVSLKEIANAIKVSPSFLAKILQAYSRAGIVSSIRGVRGGYLLKKAPTHITLRDLVANIVDPNPIGACPMIGRICPRQSGCTIFSILLSLEKTIYQLVTHKTLVDLCNGSDKENLQCPNS